MELSDNPHPVGTKEHHRWVVDVYIPALDDDQKEQHRKRAGAEAIGRELIDGTPKGLPIQWFASGLYWLNGEPVPVQSFTLRPLAGNYIQVEDIVDEETE